MGAGRPRRLGGVSAPPTGPRQAKPEFGLARFGPAGILRQPAIADHGDALAFDHGPGAEPPFPIGNGNGLIDPVTNLVRREQAIAAAHDLLVTEHGFQRGAVGELHVAQHQPFGFQYDHQIIV